MKKSLTLLILLATILVRCADGTESQSTSPTEPPSSQDPAQTTPAPETQARKAAETPAKPPIWSVEPSNERTDENNGAPLIDLHLHPSDGGEAIFLVTDHGYLPLTNKADWPDYNIPDEAAWAFNSWYAGGGYYYYGIAEGDRFHVYRTFIDEGMGADHQYTWEHFKTIGDAVPHPDAGHYICYTEDNGASPGLSIHFGSDGRAVSVRYQGQTKSMDLQRVGVAHNSDGAHPIDTETYHEIVKGQVNGTYELTHSGIYDYATYTRGKDGKTFHFTIDHDLTDQGGSYRTSPCFQ